jgi:hypothetical protein
MTLDVALRRYRANEFTDDDVVGCTDLSLRKWRELIKDKMVRTEMHSPGRGRVRLCDAVTLKRAAVIAALNRAGLSLPVSAQIAYFAPFHTALYDVIDPSVILLDGSSAFGADGLPPSLPRPRTDWFERNRPLRSDADGDWWIEIHEYRFVAVKYGGKRSAIVFGDLRDAGTRFVAWIPSHRMDGFVGCGIERLAAELRPNAAQAYAAWEDPTRWSRELKALGYSHEERDKHDALRAVAAAVIESPLFIMRVNVSLAIRKALRRYLGIDAAERESFVTGGGEPGKPTQKAR